MNVSDDIMNIAVVGFTIGVAAKSFELLNKTQKKSKSGLNNSILSW